MNNWSTIITSATASAIVSTITGKAIGSKKKNPKNRGGKFSTKFLEKTSKSLDKQPSKKDINSTKSIRLSSWEKDYILGKALNCIEDKDKFAYTFLGKIVIISMNNVVDLGMYTIIDWDYTKDNVSKIVELNTISGLIESGEIEIGFFSNVLLYTASRVKYFTKTELTPYNRNLDSDFDILNYDGYFGKLRAYLVINYITTEKATEDKFSQNISKHAIDCNKEIDLPTQYKKYINKTLTTRFILDGGQMTFTFLGYNVVIYPGDLFGVHYRIYDNSQTEAPEVFVFSVQSGDYMDAAFEAIKKINAMCQEKFGFDAIIKVGNEAYQEFLSGKQLKWGSSELNSDDNVEPAAANVVETDPGSVIPATSDKNVKDATCEKFQYDEDDDVEYVTSDFIS